MITFMFAGVKRAINFRDEERGDLTLAPSPATIRHLTFDEFEDIQL